LLVIAFLWGARVIEIRIAIVSNFSLALRIASVSIVVIAVITLFKALYINAITASSMAFRYLSQVIVKP
jgi:hypothetical protein